ncbi:GntR family transcriptional regulator [Caulobacter sp. 602-2]|uniref:GntR family transcriptional regulator n=1 Tax=Caulobacter sp. 602-2 TaxID=2710887 RepID=A0A6G4QUT1_9CAUL|nr:GntR family transcriptional regulator [Caulobacter sp. 602-2]NGM49380.1 GntR family transcriptional regulator [Caulobacter sp. 602-2]
MPPPRDAFGQALDALRRRLRSGVDAPGAPLPINLIAAELRLSPTPVREALSRLAGEDLVEKTGPAYTRPRLDGRTLAELYALRLRYLTPSGVSGPAGPDHRSKSLRYVEALADGGHTPELVVEALFVELVQGADDLVLLRAHQRCAERLAPFQPIEARMFPDRRSEALGLVAAYEVGEARQLRDLVRRYHRRRMAASVAIVRLADGAEKYRPDII